MDWKTILETLVYAVITIILPIIVKPLWSFLSKKAVEAASKADNETTQKYLNLAWDIVDKSVTYVAQTYVDSLKESGTFDEVAAKEAFQKAKDRAVSLLSDELRAYIAKAYGDVDLWLETMIEATVKSQKNLVPVVGEIITD